MTIFEKFIFFQGQFYASIFPKKFVRDKNIYVIYVISVAAISENEDTTTTVVSNPWLRDKYMI